MKNIYRLFVLLPALLLATLAPAQTCENTPNSGASFVALDGSQEVTTLCVGREIRLEDRSGRPLNANVVNYAFGAAIQCDNNSLQSVTTYIPTAADGARGFVIITQNTPRDQPRPGESLGIIFSKRFEVKRTGTPTFNLTVCSPGQVEVNITDDIYDANLYTVQIGDNSTPNVQRGQPRFYSIPAGATTVTVTGQHAGNDACSGSDTKNFTPIVSPGRPVIQQLTVREKEIIFRFANLQPGYEYELQIADASAPDGYTTLGGKIITPDYFLQITPNSNFVPGCYVLRASSACAASVNTGFPRSNQVCTVGLTTIQLVSTSSNGQNKLEWNTFDPELNAVSYFEISRDDAPIPGVGRLSGTTREFVDTLASCGTVYTYQVTAALFTASAAGALSLSNKSSVQTAAGRPPLPPRLVATFTLSNKVELYATSAGGVPLPNELTFLRVAPAAAEVGVVNAPTISDAPTNLSVATPPTYLARRRDACGSLSGDSNPAAPVVLAAEPRPEGTLFTWSALVGPDPSVPVRYQIVRIALNGATIDTQPTTGLSFVDSQPPSNQSTVRYRIEATGGGLVTASYSNLINVTQQPRLAMPTAFSPNGDGLNDVLEVKGRFIGTFVFTVIDRNGQEVFRGTDRTQTWNGRINGREPVPGAYAWRFESLTEEGKRFVQHGTITIVR